MGHSIAAFIARSAAFSGVGLNCPVPAVDLPQGLSMLPLTQELWSWIHGDADPDSLRYRVVDLSRWDDADHAFLTGLAQGMTVAYVETSYHGGDGEQRAIVARQGAVVYGPQHGHHGPINTAMRYLGVRPEEKDSDEFDTLGLRWFRSNGDLIRAPTTSVTGSAPTSYCPSRPSATSSDPHAGKRVCVARSVPEVSTPALTLSRPGT